MKLLAFATSLRRQSWNRQAIALAVTLVNYSLPGTLNDGAEAAG
jgi:NAD(P)H-dependent FMN reductase